MVSFACVKGRDLIALIGTGGTFGMIAPEQNGFINFTRFE